MATRPCPICGHEALGRHCDSTACPWSLPCDGCGTTVNWSTVRAYDRDYRDKPWPKKPEPT